MIKAVIFDLEGTLVDFQWKLTEGEGELKKALEKFGFRPDLFWKDNYAQIWNKVIEIAPPEVLQKIKDCLSKIFDRYDQDALSRWSLKPGTEEILFNLNEQGVKIGLVTNVGKKAAKEVLFRFNLTRFFHQIITRNDTKFMKPRGEGIELCIAGLGAGKEHTLFIGDSLSDIFAAKETGIKVAIVKGGESSTEEILAASPDYFLDSIQNIPTIHQL
ncbi:MAG: HAD family hydrolase [Desulfotomaculales bacterium]